MGQFSWLDCKTNEQILDDVERDVYVLVPREFGGGHIKETCYDGYGNFGDHDIYDLVVDWNKKYLEDIVKEIDTWVCDWDEWAKDVLNQYLNGEEPLFQDSCFREKRSFGITLACYDKDNARLRYPIKITHDKNAVYEWCPPSKSDPNQGWEWESEYDEDEWY